KIALELAQVQRAGLRRHAVTQIGPNRFKFETHEAADAFRGLLIEIAFQVQQIVSVIVIEPLRDLMTLGTLR
ncbi:MAG: hypothetical protein CMO47_00630, partial [Verrucomicrobiales bacterium]|nr:hypothetical protein [Verrucomicrobiales bacterium]